jgi:Zn-dependent M16 (insulinase) family peptidase
MKFQEKSIRSIPSIQASLYEYEEPLTGARHIHFANNDAEMGFLVAFPTVPDKSDGRAHILEHLVLCGSVRYPVRDPFFSMLKRSTATFMNAMTSPDRTVYPFASTDNTDFFNLLNVYLDAAFFPNLDYLDFLQEGWRYTFEGNKLGYAGVVFNEMKGAFADPLRELSQSINAILFKGTTYEFEYGGDPLIIPSLNYEDLKTFHASHYHPSQAIFMSSGRVDPITIQRVIIEQVLSKFDTKVMRCVSQLAAAWTAPKATTVAIPSVAGAADEHGTQIAWLLGEAADPMQYCQNYLLESGLVGDASSPVLKAMETAGYGRPSTFNGLDPYLRQMVFHLGMEGLMPEQTIPARKMIWDALETAAQSGTTQESQKATLRDMRFTQRQIKSGSTPYGLRKLIDMVPLVIADSDPIFALDSETIFAEIEEQIRDPNFFKKLVEDLLVNPTRLDVTVFPDNRYFEKRQAAEESQLASYQSARTSAELGKIKSDNDALLAHQRKIPNNAVLPRITPASLGRLPRPLLSLPETNNDTIGLEIASNGVSYAKVIYDISHLPQASWPWLDLYVTLLPDLGVEKLDFEAAAAWRQALVPRFDVELEAFECLTLKNEVPELKLHLSFSARNLRDEAASITEVLTKSVSGPRLDESNRIEFLVECIAQNLAQELGENGDRYAAYAANAPYSIHAEFENQLYGIDVLRFYDELVEKIQSETGMKEVIDHLKMLDRQVKQSPVLVIGAGVGNDGQLLAQSIVVDLHGQNNAINNEITWGDKYIQSQLPRRLKHQVKPANLAFLAPVQVNHCFASWAVPYLGHPDCAILSVLAHLMTNQILHPTIREEGGAYAGQAKNTPESGIFTMYSYRDPRLADTYRDFNKAIEWVLGCEIQYEHIEEAIIGVISELDKPLSPYDEAMLTVHLRDCGATYDMRVMFRKRVLECDQLQLKEVAKKYLLSVLPSRSAFVNKAVSDLAGLYPIDLTSHRVLLGV